jgi:hypothetical protein
MNAYTHTHTYTHMHTHAHKRTRMSMDFTFTAFKPAVRLQQHPFRGAPAKPDCVEVVVREVNHSRTSTLTHTHTHIHTHIHLQVVDLLLFDAATSGFDVTRLPPTASQGLRDFFTQVVRGACLRVHRAACMNRSFMYAGGRGGRGGDRGGTITAVVRAV